MTALTLACLLVACAPQASSYDDIYHAYVAKLHYLANEVDAGRMTKAQAQMLAAEAEVQAKTQAEMRRAARMMPMAVGPTLCNPNGMGGFVCF